MLSLARKIAGRRTPIKSSTHSPAALAASKLARLYIAPALSARAPASAEAIAAHHEQPHFYSSRLESSSTTSFYGNSINPSLTFLPTPLPGDASSAFNEHYFPTSAQQENLAILDACLKTGNLHRARTIFRQLRERHLKSYVPPTELEASPGPDITPLDIKVYTAMMAAYLGQARVEGEGEAGVVWIESAWELLEDIEEGKLGLRPSAAPYATMIHGLYGWPGKLLGKLSLAYLIPIIKHSRIPFAEIFADPIFANGLEPGAESAESDVQTSQELADIIKTLSTAAYETNRLDIAEDLAKFTVDSNRGSQPPRIDPLIGVPAIKPVKGANDTVPINLDSLRESLSTITAERLAIDDAATRQRHLEESAYDAARKRFEQENEKMLELGLGTGALRGHTLQAWMWDWYTKLVERLDSEIAEIVKIEKSQPKSNATMVQIAPFLKLLPTSKLALITILELMRLQGTGGIADGMKTARALLTLGRAVENEYHAQQLKKDPQSFNRARDTQRAFQDPSSILDKDLRKAEAAARGLSAEIWRPEWTQNVRARVGSFLVSNVMDVATIKRVDESIDPDTNLPYEEEQPAFLHTYQYVKGKKLGIIQLNSVIAERLAQEPLNDSLHPRHLPMLVTPRPWLQYDSGGYYYHRTFAMRFKDSIEQLSYLRQASEKGNIENVFTALDVLGSTPWTINRRVFDQVITVWNSGEALGELPAENPPEEDIPRPVGYDTDPKIKSNHLRLLKKIQADRRNNHGQRCDVNYKLEIARAFLGEKFYFPHNVDFRGRAYPIPPHLNHIGNDLCRGLLTFGESRPLGERGLRWLKIHLSNVFGYSKASFDEREEFAMKHLEEIFDSADKPLDGQRWWFKADDPWQCLATCMELTSALRSPNPFEFESSLPVHQDGTCNGLQHYAALGGDVQGAKQVNLVPSDRPADVYTAVANITIEAVEADAAIGNEYALLLAGKITRKVVKQTVMTTVYGVTFIGARDQIAGQLKESGISDEHMFQVAAYLAKKVMKSIGGLFGGAQKIQTWLSTSAKLIAKSIPPERLEQAQTVVESTSKATGASHEPKLRLSQEQMTSVIWTTPMGLPIVQPYRKAKKKQVATALQTVFISDPNVPSEVNPSKQASAFPPNFVHSLDATHMIMTALDCRKKGITFASVHDSYWTHAASVEDMSETIRSTFIKLHSADILERLREEFLIRYKGFKLPAKAIAKPRLKSSKKAKGKTAVAAQPEAQGYDEPREDDDDEPIGSDAPVVPDESGFVELTDHLPPLPAKGDFDVREVSGSDFFFN
uniref:DNA-directed RNA polymerase n=1 Tax=Bartheletia paradoxa TaxID=669517 RepID=A0A2D0XI28_9BASI|nr:hypothetical protein SPAR04594 [Bartheletia paradoxa]